MSEKMLVTQALDERDLLVKKISDKIEKASFVDTIKPNEEKVYAGRCGKEEFAKDAQAAYQQITDLIDRFQKIDAAIVASNAKAEITTSYGVFTVAGAISLRGRLRGMGVYEDEADFEGKLQRKLKNEYDERIRFCDIKNGQLCIFRKNCASVPEERSAIPLQTEQSSAGLLVTVVYSTISARKFKTICLGCHSA